MPGDQAAPCPPDPLSGPRADLPPAEASLARELEAVAHRAWPPLRQIEVGGWTLRASAGSSRRGNSVWAHGGVPDAPAALAAVTDFYAAAGLPPTFQLTPVARPRELGAVLDAAGYDDTGPTDVCTVPLPALARAAAGPAGPGEARGDRPPVAARGLGARTAPASASASASIGVTTSDAPGDEWLRVAGQVLTTFSVQRAGTLAVLSALRLPTVYVTLTVDGVPAAVGRGVADDRWLGIYSMATLPAARGRGAARRVVAALAQWAGARGATHAYLQVEEVSTVARGLYADLGFRPVYRYSYRRAPLSVAPDAPDPRGGGPAEAGAA
ncbi:GNAT family N-acetyltransferase [Frankia sp. QA3]|uniref:GNAT family N-acetyltransferase n=1 Tax=Frankia sp. QA3 TaxID=710111 RepID=UPI000269D035|nr:GNAT family N-acetyltransferase [Frankia sp. QA3]EIV95219.1 acetyltransferase [Frankia sp. QA3]